MGRTVQFDGNVTFNAEKVDDITTYAVLPAELPPEELPSLKVFPQSRFSWCRVVSQFSTAGFKRRDVHQIDIVLRHTSPGC